MTRKMAELIPCAENKFPDIPDLKFYRSQTDLFYFDATHFLSCNSPDSTLNIENFLHSFAYLIAAIRDACGIDNDDLCLTGAAGEQFLEESLAIPFLAYVDRRFGPYLVERMEELIRFGFSVNDTMAKYFYNTRFDQ